MIKTQFTLYLDNRPGAIYAVTSMLAEARINIEGISVAGSQESGLAQFVASDRDATHAMLKEANIAFSSEEVAVLSMANKPGVLARGLSRLAKAGVNIDYLYGTCADCSDSKRANVVISAPDLQAVEDAWG
ncbi:MAG: ACT domain-containing protein [Verrucomicrobia bacterium]|jgi:hypothetical protein|nr:ACT domain-containing protein [Verrucomicrobiota bacterium]MBT7065750.1 ACT domain-containing protein [Verrucomicrobiota bacterium]MBT7699046.1 ACT domain-containing protein [Verrucomicrobiota bacterium]